MLLAISLAYSATPLSEAGATRLAVRLANEQSVQRFGVSPFQPASSTLRLVRGRWEWEARSRYQRGDLLAQVFFSTTGTDRVVRVNILDSQRD